MTFADLEAMKRVSDPQVSPSGKWVLFSVTDVSLEKNSKVNHLWVVPLAGGKEAQVTSGSGESNGRFSPDGKWVMYSAAAAEGRGEIFIAAWNEAEGRLDAGRPVTSLATEADGAIWAPDSRHFLFTSAVYPECESHAPLGPQRDDEEANCNALKLTVASKDPVKAMIFDHLLYRHWDHYVGARHAHVFYSSIEPVAGVPANPTDLTPASVVGDHEAPTFSLGGPLGYAISPDGKEVAYVTNLDKVPAESTNNDIFTLQLGAEPTAAKKVSTSPGSDDGPQYSLDGKWLAWRSQARNGYESDQFRLAIMDRLSGDMHLLMARAVPQKLPLLGAPQFQGWIDEFSWSLNSKFLYFSSADRGEEPLYQSSVQGDDFRRLGKAIGEWSGVQETRTGLVGTLLRVNCPAEVAYVQSFAIDDSARTFAVNFGTPGSSVPETTTSTVEPQWLTHLNDSLISSLDLSKMESFTFPGANGTKVQGFLIRPPNFDPAKKYPVKFLIHGGPQGAWGDAWSYRWNPELFAANGYVVVMVNPRGSTGYGQKFLEQVSGDWNGRPFIDLMKGLDYAEAHFPFIDKSRECALGASYGGFMADWVLTHTDRFKCIVTHDGMYNPQSAFGTTEELWFNEWEFRPLQHTGPDAVVEQNKPASEDPFRKWSPMLAIRNAKTPTLIVHSQRDYRLDVSEGLQLFTALQLRGVPSKMLYFPDESHWVLKPRNSELWYDTVNDWCDRWTGTNKYAAAGPEHNPMASPGSGATHHAH